MVCIYGAYLLSSVYKMILIFTNGKFYLCNLQMARPDQVRPHSLPFLNYTHICIHFKLHVHHNYDSSPLHLFTLAYIRRQDLYYGWSTWEQRYVFTVTIYILLHTCVYYVVVYLNCIYKSCHLIVYYIYLTRRRQHPVSGRAVCAVAGKGERRQGHHQRQRVRGRYLYMTVPRAVHNAVFY